MARSVEEIKQTMQAALMDDPAAQQAYGFAEGTHFTARFGRLSIEGILFYVFAVCAHIIERFTESHLAQVDALLHQLRPHTHDWYRSKALAFRRGDVLPDGSDTYPDGRYTQPEIERMQVVRQCAVTDAQGGAGLIMKIAGEKDGNLAPLDTADVVPFKSYINRIKDAGVPLTVVSLPPDRLCLNLTIYIDGAVMDKQGRHLIEANKPVEDALRVYLRNLPFKGEQILASLIDTLQAVPGVRIPHLNSALATHLDNSNPDPSYGDGYITMQGIDIRQIPTSGYYEINLSEDNYWRSSIVYKIEGED